MLRLQHVTRIMLAGAAALALAALGLLPFQRTVFHIEPLTNPPGASVRALAFRPDRPDTRLVSTTTGLYQTPDGGMTWSRLDLPSLWRTPASQLLWDARQPDTVYALGEFGLGIARDGGETWAVAPPPAGAEPYLGLLQEANGSAVYIFASAGLLRTDDEGGSWTPLPVSGELGRITALAAHPGEDGVLIASTERGLIRSTNRGTSWHPVAGVPKVAIQWVGLDVDPEGRLLAHSSIGVFLSEDDGATWRPVETTGSPSSRQTPELSAVQRGALSLWHARAPELGHLPGVPEDQAITAVAPADPAMRRGLLATEHGLYETLDGGLGWEHWGSTLPAAEINLLAEGVSGTLWASTPQGLAISEDGGRTWRSLLEIEPRDVIAIAADRDDAASVYVLTRQELWYSSDGGQTWSARSTPDVAYVAARLSLQMVQDGSGSKRICLLSDQLYCAPVELGSEWALAGPTDLDAPPIALLRWPSGSLAMVSLDGAVYQSRSGAVDEWQRISAGALDGPLAAVSIAPSGDALVGLTDSGTLYEYREGTWSLLRSAPQLHGRLQGAALLTEQPGRRILALGWTEDGLIAWDDDGHAPVALPDGSGQWTQTRVFAGLSPHSLYYVNGAPVHITAQAPVAHSLAPWLAAAAAMCALLGVAAVTFERRGRLSPARRTMPPHLNQACPAEAISSTAERTQTPFTPDTGMTITTPTPTAEQAPGEVRPTGLPQPGAEARPAPVGLSEWAQDMVQGLCTALDLRVLSSQVEGTLLGYMLDASNLRLGLPSALPLVISLSPEGIGAEISAVPELAARMGATSPFVLLIQPETASTGPAGNVASGPREPGAGVVMMHRSDVQALVESRDPTAALVAILRREVPLSQISPYVQSGPVPQSMFIGREYELTAVLRALYDRSIVIVGGRKIGKTSFLAHLHRQLLAMEGFAPCYVDCHHVTDSASLLKSLSSAGGVPVESASLDVLRRVIMRLRSNGPAGTEMVVLELDEVDRLVRHDLDHGLNLLNTFRSLSDEGLCRFVLCGERVLDRVARDPALPLQTFAGIFRLGYLHQEEAERLVREPLAELGIGLQDPERLVAEIVALSGRHPNILEALCQLLIDRVSERNDCVILWQDLEAVSHSSAFYDLFFEVIWGNCSTLERLISVLMASRQHFTVEQVRLALEGLGIHLPEEQLADALEGLTLAALVTVQSSGYVFASDAFSRVLRQSGFGQGFRDSLAEAFLTEHG